MRRIAIGVATLAIAAGTAVATTAPAEAQTTQQDGLVNVSVGNVNVLNNANIGVAANVVAQVCGVSVGPVAVLAEQVDRSGQTATVCQAPSGPVTISQN